MSTLGIEGLSGSARIDSLGGLEGLGARSAELRSAAEASSREARVQGTTGDGVTFSEVFRGSLERVNELQHQADTAIQELVAGRTKNIHETMLAIERADASLKLMMQVRNKVLDAYREIMRMQI